MMSKKLVLLLLVAVALTACDPGREVSPQEQREIDRQNRKVWRQMSGGYGPTVPNLQIAKYSTQRPTPQNDAAEY
jgi:hypothetical protein